MHMQVLQFLLFVLFFVSVIESYEVLSELTFGGYKETIFSTEHAQSLEQDDEDITPLSKPTNYVHHPPIRKQSL